MPAALCAQTRVFRHLTRSDTNKHGGDGPDSGSVRGLERARFNARQAKEAAACARESLEMAVRAVTCVEFNNKTLALRIRRYGFLPVPPRSLALRRPIAKRVQASTEWHELRSVVFK